MSDGAKAKAADDRNASSKTGAHARTKKGKPTSSVLLVIAGPAGSGKTTLCNRMVAEVPGFERVVTATTRAPRPGESDGVHYHFLTSAQFDSKIAAGEFLEWAVVHGANRYGTPASS